MTARSIPVCLPLVPLAVALFAAPAAQASCGQAYCVINTNWAMQGVAADPGSSRLDLRYETIDQNRLREGGHSTSGAADAEAREVGTLNRNLIATFDYTGSDAWGYSLSLPVVNRVHEHVLDPAGAAVDEKWNFTRVGDVRGVVHYRIGAGDDPADHFGFQFGVKLPTGSHRVANADATPAERALQPGSGSTDAIVGVYFTGRGLSAADAWFVQATYQHAVTTQDGFRPGDSMLLNGGYRRAFGGALTGTLQLSGVLKQRDSGPEAEPDVSGGRQVFVAPGLSYGLTPSTQVYAHLQLPLYRYVNGIQLTAARAFVAGMTVQF